LKSWAHKLSIGYAIYSIVFGLIGVVASFLWVFRPLLEKAGEQRGPEAAAAIGGALGGTIGGCFGLIYPVLLLVFMLRPHIKAAFCPPPANAVLK